MSEQINLGWLKDYTGTKFLPKTITTQILNKKGTKVFSSESIGSYSTPIFLDNGEFKECDTLPIIAGGTGATTAAGVLTNLGITATAKELNYVDGVTSGIQSQLNDKVSKSNTGVQSIAGGLVIGRDSATSAGKGRIMVSGSTNPLIGLQAIDGSGNLLTPYYFQVANDTVYLGPTSSKALSFTKDGYTTIPSKLTINGPTLFAGHLYLTGAKPASSTGNTTQIVFGTEESNHIAISSNTKMLVLNPTTGSTTGQILLKLEDKSLFPKGLAVGGGLIPHSANTVDIGGSSNKWRNVYAQSFVGALNGTLLGVQTAGSGAAYTATVNGITSLATGMSFILIPHAVSTSTEPTLNVNSLGAKTIRRRSGSTTGTVVAGSDASWLTANKPVLVTYDGTYWIAEVPENAITSLNGVLPISQGGTGATTAAAALTNLGITATAGELNYVDGVTSNIQTQLNGKLGTSATAAAAKKLSTARKITINLASTTINSFNGSADVTTGITGTLPFGNGGTGATASDFQANGFVVVSSNGSKIKSIAPSESGGAIQWHKTYYKCGVLDMAYGGLETDTTSWKNGSIPVKRISDSGNYYRECPATRGLLGTLTNEEIPVYLVGGDVRTLAGISSGTELPESGNTGDIFLLYDY